MLYEKKTGNYNKAKDLLGQWDDSLMAGVGRTGPVMNRLGGDEQNGFTAGNTPVHPHLNLTTKDIVRDLERIVAGRGDRIETPWVREQLMKNGIDAGTMEDWMRRLSEKSRRKLHNKLVEGLRSTMVNRDMLGMTDMLLVGKDNDVCLWLTSKNERIETTCGVVRAALRMTVSEFLALPPKEKLKVCARVSHRIVLAQQTRAQNKVSLEQRTLLHQSLAVWAQGKLVIERPSGSSLHHLIDYDATCTEGTFAGALKDQDCQTIIVEHDWSSAVPPTALGEWHLPFELVCWEFRISGVRVLAFTDCSGVPGSTTSARLWLTYGRDGHWVSDDYNYVIGDGLMIRHESYEVGNRVEFKNLARLVHDCIRSACIMMDAQIVRHEPVRASQKLNEKTTRTGASGSTPRPLRGATHSQ